MGPFSPEPTTSLKSGCSGTPWTCRKSCLGGSSFGGSSGNRGGGSGYFSGSSSLSNRPPEKPWPSPSRRSPDLWAGTEGGLISRSPSPKSGRSGKPGTCPRSCLGGSSFGGSSGNRGGGSGYSSGSLSVPSPPPETPWPQHNAYRWTCRWDPRGSNLIVSHAKTLPGILRVGWRRILRDSVGFEATSVCGRVTASSILGLLMSRSHPKKSFLHWGAPCRFVAIASWIDRVHQG